MIMPEQLRPRLLEGKTAVITGGASGIGKAIAQAALREGAVVALLDINRTRLHETREELASHGAVYGYPVDILNKPAIELTLTQFEKQSGTNVDTLINNAGIAPAGTLEGMSDEIWDQTLAVNLTGARNMTQTVGRRMKQEGNGSITFITSMITAQSVPYVAAYEVSKHGVVGLMRAAALELAPYGIRSNAVAPGLIVPTGITENMPENQLQKARAAIPLGREGTPDDVAEIVVFLASDRAAYVTGAEWRVDGGISGISPVAR